MEIEHVGYLLHALPVLFVFALFSFVLYIWRETPELKQGRNFVSNCSVCAYAFTNRNILSCTQCNSLYSTCWDVYMYVSQEVHLLVAV